MKQASIPSISISEGSQLVAIHEGINQFEIHRLEDLKDNHSLVNDSSTWKARYEILWIRKGKGILQADRQLYPVYHNIMVSLAPGTIYKILETDMILEGYHISFCPEFLQSLRGQGDNGISCFLEESIHPLFLPVPDHIHAELESIAHKMRLEYLNCFNQRLEVLKGLLNIFIIYFSRNMIGKEESRTYTRENLLYKKFMSLVRKNFTSMKMVSDYAELLCVSPNYINKIVKKITGNTASHHIQQQIVREAKKRAVYYGSSLKETAYHLGFDDLAHFSRIFKNNSGASFSCFKKGI